MLNQPTGFQQIYPHIAEWASSYGWIEIGAHDYSTSLVRALDEGGMIWESSADDATLDEVLETLDTFLAERLTQYG